MPLTEVAIRNAKPLDKTYRMFDGHGLYLEIAPSGGKWWRFKYRYDGKEKRLSLGTYPDVGLKSARERLEEVRKLVANGIDPSINRKAQKKAKQDITTNTFGVIALEWFSKFQPTWAPTHSSKIIRRLEVDVLPWLGKRPISEINALEILNVLRRIEDRGALDTG